MKWSLVFLFMTFLLTTLSAQEVVISEYRNSVDQEAEWTEVLVIQDNVDLRGYILTDNRGAGDRRQSGPQFKDIPFWQHVRAGTIILIYHGPESIVQNMDEDPADGYLELSQQDLTYFDIVSVDGANNGGGMNINQDRDFVQVLTPDTAHVHGLMHGRPSGATWDNTPGPKAGYDTSNIGPRSICVSGRSLAAYAAGRNNDSTSTGRYMTPGLPNRVDQQKERLGLPDVNYLFWQEVREPAWINTPAIQVVTQSASEHVISWTEAQDAYPDDRATQYLLLRDTNNFVGFPEDVIVDGNIVDVGERIGTAEVLDLVPTIDGTTYTDRKGLECGTSYTYRVYIFRFGPDDQLGEPDPETSRGRQYHPLYAQSELVTKPNPDAPVIRASRTAVCPGDTVTLTTNTTNADTYEWTVNGFAVPVGGTTTIVVREIGTYQLTVTSNGGCFAVSNTVTITSLPAPEVELTPLGTQTICNGDTLELRAGVSAPTYEWRRNGVVIPGERSQTLLATQAGEYQVLIETQQGCPGISNVTRIRIPDVQYSFQPTLVDFGTLGACETSTSATVDLVNDGTDVITLSQITMPPGFALVSPAPGFTLQPGERVTLTLLFAPSGIGVTNGIAEFRATPCNVRRTLSLTGERIEGEIALDRAGIDFGTFTACPTTDIREVRSFTLTNSGAGEVTVRAPLVAPPFYLLTQFQSVVLPPGESFTIQIQYRPLGPDLDQGVTDVIGFPFSSVNCSDTLLGSLQAATFFPRLELAESSMNLGFVLSCVGYVDTTIEVRNTSPVQAEVTGNTSAAVVLSGTPLTIPAGESRSIPVRITPPPGAGGFVVRDTVIGEACTQQLAVRYSGNWFAGTFSAEPDVVDVGMVDVCSGQSEASAQFVITASQTNGLRAPVTSVDVSAPFSVDLEPGTTIISDLTVNVLYSPTIPGADVDTVVIVFGPCADTVRVVVRGQAGAAARTSAIDDPDFGTLMDGESAERTITIHNIGSSPLPVEPLEGITPPFSVVSSQPPLPAEIQPGDSAVVVIEYVYFGPDRFDTTRVVSRTAGQCADTVEIVVTGATAPSDPVDGIVVVIPDDLTAPIGSSVDIPVSLESAESLQGAGLSQIVLYVRYDGSILKVESATSAIPGVSATASEVRPGRARIAIDAAELRESDPILVLRGRTFLGSSRSTILEIDSIQSTTGTVTGDDGQLLLTGECAVETQVISLGSPPAIRVASSSSEQIGLEITTLTDDPVSLRMSDVRGRRIWGQDFTVRPGVHVVTIPLHARPAGALFIQMEHGRFLDTVPVLTVH